ncbi:hypothetical protein TESG_00693 [Trichophyton tonsurans CBS 112818]|uniref:Uncharacterized protein n=1 Tax=Trichophyton tonsurans (strain CBS 112818) TaxID=647933 RepID=F2RP83_TRIT1|nr:hypothetical protein TESG_00693 [Trichophyton tonsurans CBS 112818]
MAKSSAVSSQEGPSCYTEEPGQASWAYRTQRETNIKSFQQIEIPFPTPSLADACSTHHSRGPAWASWGKTLEGHAAARDRWWIRHGPQHDLLHVTRQRGRESR